MTNEITAFSGRKAYPFKRHFVKNLEEFIKGDFNVLFLIGPRKCGKTVALKQLQEELPNSVYHDFKVEPSIDTILQIEQSILKNESKVYLLDEFTYREYADRYLARLAGDFDEVVNTNTKIVVTGSQSLAIRVWGHRAFSATAVYLDVTFLSYSEWLEFNRESCCENSWIEFVLNTDSFYKFSNVREYLQSCIDETIVSNSKSLNILFDNDCDGLTVDLLISVLYTVMFTLHNHVNIQSYKNLNSMAESIKYWFAAELPEEAAEKISIAYQRLGTVNYDLFRRAIWFLLKADLITLTYFSQGVADYIDVVSEFTSDSPRFNSLSEFFKRFNVCIKYPMFYVSVLKDLCGVVKLPGPLLGSMVECYTRGLVGNISYEFRKDAKEIDFISYETKTAIEFTVSNKRIRNTNFDVLGEGWTNVLLTKDVEGCVNGVKRIPYYEFIMELEQGKIRF